MKRFASHYTYLPGQGFLKRWVVETCEKHIVRLFPLTEEVENTEWLAGVIVLLPEGMQTDEVLFDAQILLEDIPREVQASLPKQTIYLFYPFDFIGMKPVAETRHTRLR